MFPCLKLESTIVFHVNNAKGKNVAVQGFFLVLSIYLLIHKNFNSSAAYTGLETGTSAQRRYSLLHCNLQL